MKFNFSQSVICVALSALISYGLYAYCNNDLRELITIGGFLSLLIISVGGFGLSIGEPRTDVNRQVVSAGFFVIALISNLIFMFSSFQTPSYIIVNGLLLLLFWAIQSFVVKANK